MVDLDKQYQRQTDLIKNSDLDIPIWIIGAGGIGSWTALALSKMGCSNLIVFDHDKVELHNLPSQLYNPDQIGQNKVGVLKENILKFTGQTIIPISSKFEEWENLGSPPQIIISAVDSLESRKIIWDKLKLNFHLYLDARMGGEFLRIFSISPLNDYSVDQYQKSLNSLTHPHEEPCTARSIIYNVFFCAGILSNYIKRYIKNEPIEYQTQLDLSIMQFV